MTNGVIKFSSMAMPVRQAVSLQRNMNDKGSYRNIKEKRYFCKTFFKKNKWKLKKIISFFEKVEKRGGIFIGKGL